MNTIKNCKKKVTNRVQYAKTYQLKEKELIKNNKLFPSNQSKTVDKFGINKLKKVHKS